MAIFDYTDYKQFVRDRIRVLPKNGHGQLKKIADHLNVDPTIVTQVFSGVRELTPEQALLLADFFALDKGETRFLNTLVQYARAGTHRYRESLKEEIEERRMAAREISSRVKQNVVLTDEIKSAFYANWYYLAIFSLTAIEGFNDAETIAKRLLLPLRRVREALDFLLKYSLVVEDKNGRYKIGRTVMHMESNSSEIPRHHQNWRLQAFRHYETPGHDDAFYSAPVTLSASDVRKIRENILRFIANTVDVIKDSPSEKLYCLNIDWFEI